jgi:SpoVK/Ycf46/Vps4 family AAA+-type ATPase
MGAKKLKNLEKKARKATDRSEKATDRLQKAAGRSEKAADRSEKAATRAERAVMAARRATANAPRTTAADQLPIHNYDVKTVEQIVSQLSQLSRGQLREVKRYRKDHNARPTALHRIDELRVTKALAAYEGVTVDETPAPVAGTTN